MKTKKVFKKNIALGLIARGNKVLYTEPNYKKNWLVVFIFEDTDKLEADFTTVSNEINK